jgi:hypothetical protein
VLVATHGAVTIIGLGSSVEDYETCSGLLCNRALPESKSLHSQNSAHSERMKVISSPTSGQILFVWLAEHWSVVAQGGKSKVGCSAHSVGAAMLAKQLEHLAMSLQDTISHANDVLASCSDVLHALAVCMGQVQEGPTCSNQHVA